MQSFVCTLIPLNSLLLVLLCSSESSSQVHFTLVQSKLSQILLKIRHKMIVFFSLIPGFCTIFVLDLLLTYRSFLRSTLFLQCLSLGGTIRTVSKLLSLSRPGGGFVINTGRGRCPCVSNKIPGTMP